MITVKDSSRCCGCTACQSICPHDAVTMKADRLGFLYPEVDADKCVDCGLCESVCAFTSDMARQMEEPDQLSLEVHAARHNDSEVVGGSQSGGVFTALSDIVLDDGGVVYGAAFDDEFNVCHKRALTRIGRDAMRGSKYVQSDLSGCPVTFETVIPPVGGIVKRPLHRMGYPRRTVFSGDSDIGLCLLQFIQCGNTALGRGQTVDRAVAMISDRTGTILIVGIDTGDFIPCFHHIDMISTPLFAERITIQQSAFGNIFELIFTFGGIIDRAEQFFIDRSFIFAR